MEERRPMADVLEVMVRDPFVLGIKLGLGFIIAPILVGIVLALITYLLILIF